MPKAAFELVGVLFLFLIWYRRYKQLQHRPLRMQVRSRRRIRAIFENVRCTLARRFNVPSNTVPNAEPVQAQSGSEQRPTPEPTGVTGVVVARRRLIRCTEYTANGELQTEICTVDATGQVLNQPSVVPGPFRRVAVDVLDEKNWRIRWDGR